MPPRSRKTIYRDWPEQPKARFSPTGATVLLPFDTAEGSEHLLISEGHPYRKIGKFKGDIGGDFHTLQHFFSEYPKDSGHKAYCDVVGKTVPTATGIYYRGRQSFIGVADDSSYPSAYIPSNTEMDAKGATAISRCIPTNPLNSLSTSLGELREGIPSLIGATLLRDRNRIARSAGSEYLNVEFGWKPLVSEIQGYAATQRDAERITANYERNSGKRIFRRYDFPTVTEVLQDETRSGWYEGLPHPSIHESLYVDGGASARKRLRLVRTTKWWFEGCFTYYLPPRSESRARSLAIANKLYGTRLTPETLWDLSPWTWAADWVGNFGDVLHNVSAFTNDGLVMPYGYIMCESTATYTSDISGVQYKSYPGSYSCGGSLTTISKKRRRATPFGFGLDFSAFTGRQLSILGALGLSRLF